MSGAVGMHERTIWLTTPGFRSNASINWPHSRKFEGPLQTHSSFLLSRFTRYYAPNYAC